MIPPFTVFVPSIQYLALRSEWVCLLVLAYLFFYNDIGDYVTVLLGVY
jgi:hypothetical protein